MKTVVAALLLSSLSLACIDSEAADYKPVSCTSAGAYVGAPLYPGSVQVPIVATASAAAFDTATIQRLDQAQATAMARMRVQVMTAAVSTAVGSWSSTKTANGAAPPAKLWWASVGKAFTAVVIMQLVEEGKLSLSDPLARWLKGFPNAAVITVDDLLQHTAGIFSANEDLVVRRKRRYYTPEENIAIAAKHGAMFCPGERWRYSNTGYDMLGRIIEAIEGRPYHEVVATRIIDKLGVGSLRALAPNEQPADVAPLPAPADPADAMTPSWAYAAGAIVGSAQDMIVFWRALLAGGLLNKENTARLFERLYPMFDPGTFYGRGVMLYSFNDLSVPRTWLGHSGGAPGAKAVVVYSPDDQALVAVAITGDGSVEAAANALLQQLRLASESDASRQ
jgi:D-alanyl-D-alanine carboxypeptidase